jgi:hypothetical protein
MDYFTSVALRLDQQRATGIARDAELLRRQAERAAVQEPGQAPARRSRVTAAWRSFRVTAHLGHPVAH